MVAVKSRLWIETVSRQTNSGGEIRVFDAKAWRIKARPNPLGKSCHGLVQEPPRAAADCGCE
jgi:hypothetical protein